MIAIQNLHLFGEDISASQTWTLLDWCSKQGVDEFTVDLLWLADSAALLCDEFEAALASFRLPDAMREHLTAATRADINRSTRLWRMSAESQSLLQSYLKDGLFTPPSYSEGGWLEDPTFYRNGSLILGIVSHENEGLARVTADEALQFTCLGIQTRSHAEWI